MGMVIGGLFFKNKFENIDNVPKSFFELNAKDIKGNNIEFINYKNRYKAYLLVNVACLCGLTYGNYQQLSDMFEKYKNDGFTVLAFPCNQFHNQEKNSEEDIEEFVKSKFNAQFQLFSKIDVNGPNTHPVFRFLRANSELHDPLTVKSKEIPWNFAKFLLDKDGKVVKYYNPTVEPQKFEEDVKKLLGK